MIPTLDKDGNLPPGRHSTTWADFAKQFGTTPHRIRLLAGMKRMLQSLKQVGCGRAYIDGSFVTAKVDPGDYDGCWDGAGVDLAELRRVDPVLVDFSNKRVRQKLKYGGEMFPADMMEVGAGVVFLEFFERDKSTGNPKGIIEIDLKGI